MDARLLGPEAMGLHEALCSLEAQARAEIASFAASVDAGTKIQHAAFDTKVQGLLAAARARLRELDLLAEEQDTPEETHAVAACLQLHKLEHEALRGAIGSAKVAVQRAVAAKLAAQRAELLAGAPPGAANGTAAGAAAKPLRSEGDLLAASNDITQGLRRTRQLMAQQIETTSGNLALLDQGNAALQASRDELSGQRRHFKRSRSLLGALKRQELGDRALLWAGFALFLAVAAYVAFKRSPDLVKAPLYVAYHALAAGLQRLAAAATGSSAHSGRTAGASGQAGQPAQLLFMPGKGPGPGPGGAPSPAGQADSRAASQEAGRVPGRAGVGHAAGDDAWRQRQQRRSARQQRHSEEQEQPAAAAGAAGAAVGVQGPRAAGGPQRQPPLGGKQVAQSAGVEPAGDQGVAPPVQEERQQATNAGQDVEDLDAHGGQEEEAHNVEGGVASQAAEPHEAPQGLHAADEGEQQSQAVVHSEPAGVSEHQRPEHGDGAGPEGQADGTLEDAHTAQHAHHAATALHDDL